MNTCVKALDGIYKIYRLLHRSDLKISAKKSEIVQHESSLFEIALVQKFVNLVDLVESFPMSI